MSPQMWRRIAGAWLAFVALWTGVVIASCSSLLPGSSVSATGYGVSATARGPWVPDPAPTIYAWAAYVCASGAPIVRLALDAGVEASEAAAPPP